MAHLEVKPKSKSPWWLWLLLAIIALAILLFLYKGCGNETKQVATTDSTSTEADGVTTLATTEPDWDKVDFNAPESTDPDITDEGIRVRGNNEYTIYSLGENVLFSTDQNTIQGSAEGKLKQIIASLNKRFPEASIGVFGNTDSTGTAGHNKQLGAERAAAVKDWLVKNGGVEESRVSIHSSGEKEPVASNATSSGRQQNRNVEIVAYPAAK